MLFARFDAKYAYFINVYPYGKDVPPPWTKQVMIKMLHNNWPDSISKYRCPIDSMVTKDGKEIHLTDSQYKDLRNSFINTLIEVERGVFYFGTGGGYMADGRST